MHDEVQFTRREEGFEFGGPEGFSVEGVQGGGFVAVAEGVHGVDAVVVVWVGALEGGVDDGGLEAGEVGATGANGDWGMLCWGCGGGGGGN